MSYRLKEGNGVFVASSIIGGVFLISSYGISVATTSLGLSIGAIGLSYSGFGLVLVLPLAGYEIYQRYKSNDKKISDYFEKVKSEINRIKQRYIRGINDKKKEFLLNLDNSKTISDEEIKFLKRENYQEKFKKFLNKLNL